MFAGPGFQLLRFVRPFSQAADGQALQRKTQPQSRPEFSLCCDMR
jgi:hypothetical protein